VVAVGSLLEPPFWPGDSAKTFRGTIWGTGRMEGKMPIAFPNARIAAVRGRLTAETLDGPVPEDVVLGEPGLLVRMFYRKATPTHKLGLIPHWSQRGHPVFQAVAATSTEIKLIDICRPIQEVIDEAARCEAILASALHGLILADALEKPNHWLRFERSNLDHLGTPEFKYRDYYTVFGLEEIEPMTISAEDTLDTLLARMPVYKRGGLERIQEAVLRAFRIDA
jgi:hypothetical protein